MESRLCYHFLKGRCFFGSNCRNVHEAPSPLINVGCLLIRHGESKYNKRLVECTDKWGSEAATTHIGKKMFQLDPSLIDCGLTEEGYKQALKLRYKHGNTELDLILTSPLERALETADIIFKGNKTPIVVLPRLAEILSKVCDISGSIYDKKKRYPHMDFSLFSGRETDWQLDFLSYSKRKTILGKTVDNLSPLEETLTGFYLQQIEDAFPYPIESNRYCAERVRQLVKDIKAKFVKEKIKNVAIVAHRRILREITSSPSNPLGHGFDNCYALIMIL